jgi:hypothetical protein
LSKRLAAERSAHPIKWSFVVWLATVGMVTLLLRYFSK